MKNSQKHFYLNKFKEKTFIIKIGGEVIKSKETLTQILSDIKELFEFGIKIIIVHGGGTQADDLSHKLGHTTKKINGRRITNSKDLEVCKMIFGGTLNLEIISILRKLNVNSIRVSGLDGGLIEEKKRDSSITDFGHVGDIEKINPEILQHLLEKNVIPIVSPLAVDKEGEILNINADTIATKLASKINAEKLILMTNVDGIYNNKSLMTYLSTSKAQDLIKKEIIKSGMKIKTESCIAAIKAGVKRIHIINGLSPHSLLIETFTQKGIGTMILSDQESKNYISENS